MEDDVEELERLPRIPDDAKEADAHALLELQPDEVGTGEGRVEEESGDDDDLGVAGDEPLGEVHHETSALLLAIDLEDDLVGHDVPHEDEADVHDVERELDAVLAPREGPPFELEEDVHHRRAED